MPGDDDPGAPLPTAAGQALAVRALTPADESAWTAFLETRPDSNLYHSLLWRDLVADVFHHRPAYLFAKRGATLTGILPLFLIRNRLLGSKLVSLPYDLGSGGALAVDAESERKLCMHAIADAHRAGVRYLELRSDRTRPALDDLGLTVSNPVILTAMELDGESRVWGRVSRDHAKALRKARNRGVDVRLARTQREFTDFYSVYLKVFRAFGTPPYGAHYFRFLFDRLHAGGHVKLFLAIIEGRCVGGLLLFCWQKNLVSKFAACLPEAVPKRAYAALYGAAIEYGLQAGFSHLDWGSSARSQTGLIEFKEGWGAQSHPAVVYGLPVRGTVPDVAKYYEADGAHKRIWRRLPLAWTRVMGHPLNRWFC